MDKIHSTNHTISVFKKVVDSLKKKCKKVIEISKPRKAQKYSKEIANKEDITGTLCMTLSRHVEALKNISSSGCNNVIDHNSGMKKSYNDSDERIVELEEME